ncbi:MAG: protein kinase [Gemmatimonadaceae bacterium]
MERELGAGGMATVYLAADLKHDRNVALKVLKPELAAVLGADRFVVEIKTTAALQHPHILPLFDSGTADGFLFYVMPYIEGETLRDKLNRETQFGVDEAVRIACEVADALDYAHRHGVIHRDIKPENILLHDGRPMVADFGIALALSAAAGGRMTETGLSLGTPHYMSPEQATAEKEITGRSDVYSLASVLYEMLTGEPPHMGKSAQQIIMKIIAEPVKPVTELRKSVPTHIADAVAQALEKLPADRFGTAADFAGALKGAVTARTTVRSAAAAAAGVGPWRRIALGAGVVALGFAALAGWALGRTPDAPVTRVSVSFVAGERLQAVATRRFDISRDGARIVYIGPDSAGTRLWIREMSSLVARPLPGTNGALAPFFSPDGRSVGYLTGLPGDVRIVPLDGGSQVTLARETAAPWGADWGDDGNIYFTHTTSRIARVPAAGGPVEIVSTLDSAKNEIEHDWPQLLPDRKSVLVQIWHNSIGDATLGILDLETGRTTEILGAAFGRYLPSGHIAYSTFTGALAVVPYDVKRRRLGGAPVGIVDGVQVDAQSGSAQFAVSHTGTLLYIAGGGLGSDQVVWVDRAGRMTPVDSAWRGNFTNLALAPDATRLAVTIVSAEGEQVWVKELPRGPLTRLSFGSATNGRPVWAPDSRRVAFISARDGKRGAWVQRADGSAPAEPLYQSDKVMDEIQFTPDGRTLVFRTASGGAHTRDVFAITVGVDSAPRAISAGPFDEFGPAISPDGQWVAYVSNESGRNEVYVRRLANPGAGRTQVSVDGGEEPRWAPSGREIFFRSGRGEMLVTAVTLGARFEARERRVLFRSPSMGADAYHYGYDVARDGQRFLMVNRALADVSELVLVLNGLRNLP